MNERHIDINEFDYDLPDGRIAKFPLAERSASKLLVYVGGELGVATCCPKASCWCSTIRR